MKLHFYSDPGHGWVKVSKGLLFRLGILEDITPYSYQRGEYAYLEEDCDAGTLVEALKAAKVEFEFVMHTTDRQSKLRGYEGYRA